MAWITNKWAQVGALLVSFLAWLSIRDRRLANRIKKDAKVKDYENANRIRRRVDAARELHDAERVIEYRDS